MSAGSYLEQTAYKLITINI